MTTLGCKDCVDDWQITWQEFVCNSYVMAAARIQQNEGFSYDFQLNMV